MDIPESVTGASSTAALAGGLLADARGTMVREQVYPEERDVMDEEPRIGVFVCHCGTNIARTVDVEQAEDYARTLPNVVHAERDLYTCSTDAQRHIIEVIKEHQPDIVGMSAMLTTTMRAMGHTIKAIEEAGLREQIKVVVGGAPVDAEFAKRIGADGYGSNAPSGVDLAKQLVGAA